MTDKNELNRGANLIQRGLFVVASIGILCAFLHAIFPDRFDEETAMFLAIAAGSLVIHQITRFKGFGIEIEKEVQRLQQAIGNLEKDVGSPQSRHRALWPQQ